MRFSNKTEELALIVLHKCDSTDQK